VASLHPRVTRFQSPAHSPCHHVHPHSRLIFHHRFYSEANRFQQPYHDSVEIKPTTEPTHYDSHRSRLHALTVVMPHTTIVPKLFGDELIRYDRIKLHWNTDTVRMQYGYTDGAPYTMPGSVVVRQEHWLRVQYNARYSVDAGWVYDQWVFNIGLFRNPDAQIFVRTTPERVHAHLAQLW
jgi:hypothetical protein